jgi:hypothetical protein
MLQLVVVLLLTVVVVEVCGAAAARVLCQVQGRQKTGRAMITTQQLVMVVTFFLTAVVRVLLLRYGRRCCVGCRGDRSRVDDDQAGSWRRLCLRW